MNDDTKWLLVGVGVLLGAIFLFRTIGTRQQTPQLARGYQAAGCSKCQASSARTTYENEEVVEMQRDQRGRISKLIVHRKAEES